MSNASKGRAHEHDIQHMLEANGYAVVRGAASRGYFEGPSGRVKCDLVATRYGRSNEYEIRMLVVQAKVRKIRTTRRKSKRTVVNSASSPV